MNSDRLNRFQRLQLEVLWYVCRGFGMLPYWVRYYLIESIIFFVLYYCLRYRMKVVRENLANSFPEKSKFELLVIRRKFYHTLAEMFIDTISIAGIDERKARKLIDFKKLDEHNAATNGRDWIAMMAHYGCWEYGPMWGFFNHNQAVVSVYHPLRSKVMDAFFFRLRQHSFSYTVSMQDFIRFYLRNSEKGLAGMKMAIGLIADQNPPRRPDSHWFRFLNQDTIFFDGGEKLSLKCHLPVYFTHMKRVRRGCYDITFVPLYDGEEVVEPNEITERYVRSLERMIQESPELWMWSHRRWKHKR